MIGWFIALGIAWVLLLLAAWSFIAGAYKINEIYDRSINASHNDWVREQSGLDEQPGGDGGHLGKTGAGDKWNR